MRRTGRPGRSSTGPACRRRSSWRVTGSRPAARLPRRPSEPEGAAAGAAGGGARSCRCCASFGDGAVRHRCGGGSDDVADVGGVRGVRARDDRRPRHRRDRAPRQGGTLGDRQAPFGYRRNDDKDVVPDEREAPVVRRVFQLYTRDRLGTTSIARLLTEECAPAPARGWQPAVVQWVLENEAYLGRVHWRGQSYPGLHEPLVDEPTFQAAQALLRERGQDLTLRRGNRSDFLLSGVMRCGRCKRAYIGMSAEGNGGVYHYYACSGRQKLGRKACDGERLNRDKLEAAVLDQLAGLYRDGDLIADALQRAYNEQAADRPALEEQRRTVAEEIRRGERALDRYYQAFESGRPRARPVQDPARRPPGEARHAPRTGTRTRRAARRPGRELRPRRARRRRRPAPRHARHRRTRTDQSAAAAADQRAPRQRQVGDPPDLPRRHTRGLRNDKFSGAYRDRTDDLRLAKPALSQLS